MRVRLKREEGGVGRERGREGEREEEEWGRERGREDG